MTTNTAIKNNPKQEFTSSGESVSLSEQWVLMFPMNVLPSPSRVKQSHKNEGTMFL
jgi:hypothetical protein